MNAPVNVDYAALIREDTPDGFLASSDGELPALGFLI